MEKHVNLNEVTCIDCAKSDQSEADPFYDFVLHKFGNCLSVTRSYSQLLRDPAYAKIVTPERLSSIGTELELASRKMEFLCQSLCCQGFGDFGTKEKVEHFFSHFNDSYLSDYACEYLFSWDEKSGSFFAKDFSFSSQQIFKIVGDIFERVLCPVASSGQLSGQQVLNIVIFEENTTLKMRLD